MTYPSGQVVQYTYTARNQVKDIVADGPPLLATYAYNLDGTPASKTLENGTVTSYAFDAAYQLSSVDHLFGAVSLQRFDYSYNLAGNRTQMIRDATLKDVYSHQPDDQLSGVSYDVPVGGGAAASAASFNYDAVGNRTSVNQNGSVAAYTSNALNQYTTVGGTPYAYNGNGNLTSYTPPPGFTTSGVAWTYSYDAQNRLLSAASGANSVQITYDSRNRQVSRTVNGVVSYFIWDAWNLIEERGASGSAEQTYTHGAGVDELLCKTNASGTVYYHHDGLGSVTALSDAAGLIVEKCRYDVFGSVTLTNAMNIPLAASAYSNRFLFTGREWIAEAGLYDYRNRVYAAEIGRFLQNDPIRFLAGDVNLYRYVGNSCLFLVDPYGWVSWGRFFGGLGMVAAGIGGAILSSPSVVGVAFSGAAIVSGSVLLASAFASPEGQAGADAVTNAIPTSPADAVGKALSAATGDPTYEAASQIVDIANLGKNSLKNALSDDLSKMNNSIFEAASEATEVGAELAKQKCSK